MTSEKKMQIVIDNYFKSECNVDTSIRDAFEKGFRIGVQKTVHRPEGEWLDADCFTLKAYECSKCGNIVSIKTYYCDQCGSRMKGGAE